MAEEIFITRLPEIMKCSFCGLFQEEVMKMVAGPNALICNECIELSVRIYFPEVEEGKFYTQEWLIEQNPDDYEDEYLKSRILYWKETKPKRDVRDAEQLAKLEQDIENGLIPKYEGDK